MTSDEPRGARALLAEMNPLRARAHHGALSLFPQVRALLAEMEQQVSPMHANAHHCAARMHVLTTTPCACTCSPRRRAHARAHHDAARMHVPTTTPPPFSPQVTHAEEDELQRRRLQAISASETERNRRLEEMQQTAAEEEAR